MLLPKLKPYLRTNGGPIIAMQIENEYGSYGNDTKYLQYVEAGLIKRGIDVLLFTSDGPTDAMLQGGMVPDVLATVNFGSRSKQAFDKLHQYRPESPRICMEFWNGWFDHWGEKHHTRDPQDAVAAFTEMLESGASVNFYMFHGGTNFGFYNGANFDADYAPTVTSYDYDCPISESGDLTPKYYAVRAAIAKHQPLGELKLPEPIPKIAYGKVKLTESAELFSNLEHISEAVHSVQTESMERLGQNYGFVLYRTFIEGPRPESKLTIQEIRDRALVFVNDEYKGIIDRWQDSTISFAIPEEGAKVELLVENLGRINYGFRMKDPKGITEGVRFERQFLYDWTIYSLPLENLTGLSFTQAPASHNKPAFYKGHFQVDEIGDTFVELQGWTKGVVFINGFNLGRYWEVGPQETLYLPGPLLKKGTNEIVVFELHQTSNAEIVLGDTPKLG